LIPAHFLYFADGQGTQTLLLLLLLAGFACWVERYGADAFSLLIESASRVGPDKKQTESP
jgi:hypothetical protein